MEEQESVLHWGGVPTAPDVEAIEKILPRSGLTPGTIIPYSKIALIINEPLNSNRWRTVCNAWRNHLAKAKILLLCPGDGAFVVAGEKQKVFTAVKQHKGGIRKIRQSVIVTSWVDRKELDETSLSELDTLNARNAAIKAAVQIRGEKRDSPPSLLE